MSVPIPYDPRFKSTYTMCFYSYHFKDFISFKRRIGFLCYEYMNMYCSPLRLDFGLNSKSQSFISNFSEPSGLFYCRLYMSGFISSSGEYSDLIINYTPELRLFLASQSVILP